MAAADATLLVVAAGQEHRDYTTLALACEALPVTVRPQAKAETGKR